MRTGLLRFRWRRTQEKHHAIVVIQASARGRKGKKIVSQRKQAVKTIHSTVARRSGRGTPAPSRLSREEAIKKRSVDGSLGKKQHWALRKQLPPLLQEEFDIMCDEDQDIVGAMNLTQQEAFLKKRREKRLQLEAALAVYVASGLKWLRFFRKPEAGAEFANKGLRKALERFDANTAEFLEEDWADFAVDGGNLRMDCYIKSRDVSGEKPVACWWKPANRAPGRRKVYRSEAEEEETAARMIQKQYLSYRSLSFNFSNLVKSHVAEEQSHVEPWQDEAPLEEQRQHPGTELATQTLLVGIEEQLPDHCVLTVDKVSGGEQPQSPQQPQQWQSQQSPQQLPPQPQLASPDQAESVTKNAAAPPSTPERHNGEAHTHDESGQRSPGRASSMQRWAAGPPLLSDTRTSRARGHH